MLTQELFNKMPIKNQLKRQDVNSFDDLVKIPRHRILELRNIGLTSILIIDKIFDENGIDYVYNDEYISNLTVEEKYDLDLYYTKLREYTVRLLKNRNINTLGDLRSLSRVVLQRKINISDLYVSEIEKEFRNLNLELYFDKEEIDKINEMDLDFSLLFNNNEFPARILNSLEKRSINTLNELKMTPMERIKEFRSLGSGAINFLHDLAREYNFEFIDNYLMRVALLNPELFYNFDLKYFPVDIAVLEALYGLEINTFGDLMFADIDALLVDYPSYIKKGIRKLYNYFNNISDINELERIR